MKKIKILNLISVVLGIVILSFSLYRIQTADERWIPGIAVFVSVLFIAFGARSLSDDLILNNYKEKKAKLNKKIDKARETEITRKAASQANLLVSGLCLIAVVLIFFVKINYIVLILLITASIFLQSFLNAILYIYYDKKKKQS